MKLSPDVRAALSAGHLGHLVTINDDGSPQVSVVWTGVEDDEIVIAHLGQGVKIHNIARDPRVALTLETEGANPIGLAHYLIVHGHARLVPGGAPELLGRLAQTYLGADAVFPPMPDPPPGHVIRIAVTSVGGVGPWSGPTSSSSSSPAR